MPSIVLDSFSRASIRFEKLANQEADRLADLQISGEIDIKEARSVPFKAGADRLNRKISENEFEISKANKYIGSLENSLNAIDQMRDMVDRIKALEEAAASEENIALSTSYKTQADDLKEQIITMGETASFRGMNMFSDWGQENFQVGDQTFSAQSVNLDDIISGFAYRGGNILGIESGDFDTSAYPELVAAFGPDTINNVYADFTGNYPDAQLIGDTIALSPTGPNGSYAVDTDTTASIIAGGDYIQLPALTFPEEFTMGFWVNVKSTTAWDFLINSSNSTDVPWNRFEEFGLTRIHNKLPSTEAFRFEYMGPGQGGFNFQLDTPDGSLDLDTWAFWMISLEDLGAGEVRATVYKDGNNIAQTPAGTLAPIGEITRAVTTLGGWYQTAANTSDMDFSDFVIFDEAIGDTKAGEWYDNIAVNGLENSFFTMSADKIDDALDKLEAHHSTLKVSLEAQRDQLVFKNELYADEASNLMGIDNEEVALQSNLAQMRQTLAVTSLSITSSTQANILNLFG